MPCDFGERQDAGRRSMLAAVLLVAAGWAHGQPQAPWPTKAVKILVGFPGGSTPDVAARILADGLAKSLNQPVVVENRPGASGNIAADLVAKASDDHTLGLVINGNLSSAKLLNPRLPFDPGRDFSLLSLVASAPACTANAAARRCSWCTAWRTNCSSAFISSAA